MQQQTRYSLTSLREEIRTVQADHRIALQVRLGPTTYDLDNIQADWVTGESYAALMLGDQTLIFQIDEASNPPKLIFLPTNMVSARVLQEDLLPPPPLSEEDQKNLEFLQNYKVPEGYRVALTEGDALTIVKSRQKLGGPRRSRTQKNPAVVPAAATPSGKPPLLEKGLPLRRKKDGALFHIFKVDLPAGEITLHQKDGPDKPVVKALRGNGSTIAVPNLWKHWERVVGASS